MWIPVGGWCARRGAAKCQALRSPYEEMAQIKSQERRGNGQMGVALMKAAPELEISF